MNRRERIEELKRKNRIKLLYEDMRKEINDLQIESFIPLDEGVKIANKVVNLINKMDENRTSVKYLLKDISYGRLIKNNIDVLKKLENQNVIVFYEKTDETIALELSIAQVINNLDY